MISGSLLRDAARTCELLRDGGLDEVDGLLNRTEIFLFGVGDFDVESIFERERHFNRRQAVGTEIFNKGGFVLDVLFLDAKLFSNDLLDLLFNICLLYTSPSPRDS